MKIFPGRNKLKIFPRKLYKNISVHTQNRMLRGSRDNTVLHPKLTATMLRNHYVKELHQLKARGPIYT